MNNTERLMAIQQSLISVIVWFFSLGPIRSLFNLSPEFGTDLIKSFAELLVSFSKNSTKYIVSLLILLVVLKVLGRKLFETGSDLLLKLFMYIYDRIKQFIGSKFA